MEWTDDGIVLAVRRHGESAVIVSLLTRAHGRHAGLVRGGASARARGLYQAGNLLKATWRGRLPEHLGGYACELARSYAGPLLDEPLRLAALGALCAVAETALPEHEPHSDLFDDTCAVLELLAAGDPAWPAGYVRWEEALLRDLGYGLDLAACAVTGATEGLAYVSPKTGRAVTAEAAAPWRERLLRLPPFLRGDGNLAHAGAAEVRDGLALTGWFLDRHVYRPHGREMPAARLRFVEAMR